MSAHRRLAASADRRPSPHLARAILGQSLASGLGAAGLLTLVVAAVAPAEIARAHNPTRSILHLFLLGPAMALGAHAGIAVLLLATTRGRAPRSSIVHLLRMTGVLGVLAAPAYALLLFTAWNGRLHAGVVLASAALALLLVAISDRLARTRLLAAIESTIGLLLMAVLATGLLIGFATSNRHRNTVSEQSAAVNELVAPQAPQHQAAPQLPNPEPPHPGPAAAPPQLVLLISIDTLRADHLSAYGYPRATTPTIERLAGEGVLFERVVAASSGSLPSLATLLTGQAPWQHGVGDQRGTLNAATPTLAERFSAVGFDTVAVVVNPLIWDGSELSRGFRHLESFAELAADDAAARLLAVLPKAAGKPVFAWLHLYEPHTPYDPAAALTAEFLTDEHYRQTPLPAIEYGSYGGIRRHRTLGQRRTGAHLDLEHGFATALYDGEILAADRSIGRFLEAVQQSYSPAETVMLITADHGEELVPTSGDLFFQHALEVRQSAIQVPAILWAPGRIEAGRSSAALACQRDLTSTLAHVAGLELWAEATGVDLLAPDVAPHACVSQTAWWDALSLHALPKERRSPTYALVEDRWKLIVRFESEFERIAGPLSWLGAWRSTLAGLWKEDQLFDLQLDPEERRNRLAEQPLRAAMMKSRLQTLLQTPRQLRSPLSTRSLP